MNHKKHSLRQEFFSLSLSRGFIFYHVEFFPVFTVPFSLAVKKIRFRAKDSVIREYIAQLRANHIARITSDFKMDLINQSLSISQANKQAIMSFNQLKSISQASKQLISQSIHRHFVLSVEPIRAK